MNDREGKPGYEIHGLRLSSEIPLGFPKSTHKSSDIEIFWGGRVSVPDHSPGGEVLQELVFGNGRGFSCVETSSGYTMRFFGCCEFCIAGDLRTIRVHLGLDTDPRWAPLLLSGNVLAMVLMLSGECVLHASAVEMDGEAFAFVARSGMGKSTLAALFCLRGFKSITDDMLHIDLRREAMHCFPGTTRARLRLNAEALIEQFSPEAREQTVDKRISVRLEHVVHKSSRLNAIILPRPSRGTNRLRMGFLTPKEAMLSLSRCPRIQGIRDKKLRRSQFEAVGRIVEHLPVYEAQIPWGRKLDPELPDKMLEGVRRMGYETEPA